MEFLQHIPWPLVLGIVATVLSLLNSTLRISDRNQDRRAVKPMRPELLATDQPDPGHPATTGDQRDPAGPAGARGSAGPAAARARPGPASDTHRGQNPTTPQPTGLAGVPPGAGGNDPEVAARTRAPAETGTETEAAAGQEEVNLVEVAGLLAILGIDAVVEHTGGGCATLFAGPTRPDPDDPGAVVWAAVAGPGRYDRRADGGPHPAALAELVVGPDDHGQSAPTEVGALGAVGAHAVAVLVADQLRHPERVATDDELAAAGFDPAAARRAREVEATRRATWRPAPDDTGTAPGGGGRWERAAPTVSIAGHQVRIAVVDEVLRIGIRTGTGGPLFPDDHIPLEVDLDGDLVHRSGHHTPRGGGPGSQSRGPR